MSASRIILSISQLNNEVSQLLTQGFPSLWAEGEISNLSRPRSGHLYFSLKDAQAQLRCAMFRAKALKSELVLENGMKVTARGRVGLYEPRGDYQFIVDKMEDAGAGELQRRFDALKAKLAEQGLFAVEDKQVLPEFPRHIGIITSPSGAAVRDILNILQRRCPHIPVTIYPVAVQGDKAKTEIVAALRRANKDKRALPCDVLILARGGGSLEDLWAFNEEIVALAISECRLPIISGVGHEIDFTIADFIADKRAPTPSAAAELISADNEILLSQLQRTQQQLTQQVQRRLQQYQLQVTNLATRLTTQQPGYKLQQQNQRLDELDTRLQQTLQRTLADYKTRLTHLSSTLTHQSPLPQIQRQQKTTRQLQHQLEQLTAQRLEKQQDLLQLHAAKLNAYSPLHTLGRGYSLARDSKRRLIKSVRQVKPGQSITTQLADGSIECTVEQVQQDSF